MTFAVTPAGWRAWVLAHPRNLAACPAGMDFRLRGGIQRLFYVLFRLEKT